MAVAFVRSASGTSAASTSSITVTFTAPTAGNLLVFAIAMDKTSGAAGAVPTGWTLLSRQDGTQSSHAIYYKIATGSETTVTGTWTTASANGAGAVVAEFSGVNSSSPVSVASTPAYDNVGGTTYVMDPPAASADAGGMAVAWIGVDTATAFPWTVSAPGWTNRASGGAAGGKGTGALLTYDTALTANQDLAAQTFTAPESDQHSGSVFVVQAPAAAPVGPTFGAVGPSSAGATATNTNTLSWSHTASGTNPAVIVGVASGTDCTLTATYGGVAMTALGKAESGTIGGSGFVQLFGLLNPPTGAQTVTVTASVSSISLIGGSISYTGVQSFGTAVTGSFGDNATLPTSVSLTVPGTTSGNIVVDAVATGTGVTSSTATNRWLHNLNAGSAAGNAAQSTAAVTGSSTAIGYNISADWAAMVAVELRAAAAVASGLITQLWNGTTLVTQSSQVWDGTSLVTKTVAT